jgi:hypothetical protein
MVFSWYVWSQVDLNGDGLISFSEYIFFMTMLSLPSTRVKVQAPRAKQTLRARTLQIHTHTHRCDLDGNGHPPVDTHMHVSSCSHTQVAFDMFDLDGNGHLDQKEFATMIEVCNTERERCNRETRINIRSLPLR